MTGEELLAVKRPEDLFTGDLDAAKKQYRDLAQVWHPDRNNGNKHASDVFAHLTALYDEAVRSIEQGLWEGKGVLRLKTKRGGSVELAYYSNVVCEVGRRYIGDDHLTYLVDPDHRTLFKNAESMVGIFSYANDKMRAEASRYLPQNPAKFETEDGRLGLKVSKTPDLLLLRDVITHFGGQVPERHAAWIQSTIQNLLCYFSWAGIVHHNISPDTYFISPEFHGGALLGGWWYALKVGRPLALVPQWAHDFLPWEARTQKIATYLTDLELARATGRAVLGDAAGLSLKPKAAPKPMLDWLKSVATGTAVENYEAWGRTLTEAFGPRRFVKLTLDAPTVYAQVR